MGKWAAMLFSVALHAMMQSHQNGTNPFLAILRCFFRYPIKVLAAFIMAPFLAFRVARVAKNPVRRRIAGVGLFIAIGLAWTAGTLLGTTAGAFLVASVGGFFWGLSFFIGTTISVFLSVAFSILVLNATAWLFLQMSSEEVVEYLRTMSE